MLEQRDLQDLVAYEGKQSVVSVYVATDLAKRAKEAISLAVRNRIRALDSTPPERDIERIHNYVDYEYDWQSRGVALFSAGDALWKTIALPVPVPTQAYLTEKPYVGPLIDLIDQFEPYIVGLLDRSSLRLFFVGSGTIRSETETVGEQLKHHRQGGWAAARYQRHEDHLALRNLKQTIEVMQDYCERKGCTRLMLAGSGDVLAQVKELLPPAMGSAVIGEFPADINSSPAEILTRSFDIVEQITLDEERELVESVITAAEKGGNGVIGLPDSLYALQQGRVRLLLVHEDYAAPGYACSSCDYVAAEHSDTCPFCRAEGMQPVKDAVNRAIHKAINTGARINVIRDNEDLHRVGNIAAVLRY